MKKTFVTIALLAAFIFINSFHSFAYASNKPIALSIPESVIASAMQKVLPMPIDSKISSLKGNISLVSVRDLRIFNGGISAKIRVAGKNMAIQTNIGGHNLNMNVGTIDLNVTSDATLRFDPAKQVLYIRPTIKETKSQGNGDVSEIGGSLVSLLSGHEFPIALQKIQALVSYAGTRQIILTPRIVGVKPRKGMLNLELMPYISTKKTQ